MFAASTALPISLRDFDDFEAMDLEARQDALSCHAVDVNQIKSCECTDDLLDAS
jgi:hypothetical protein